MVTQGWNGYRNESAQKVDPGEDNSPAAPAGDSNPRPSDHESGAVTTEVSPASISISIILSTQYVCLYAILSVENCVVHHVYEQYFSSLSSQFSLSCFGSDFKIVIIVVIINPCAIKF